MTKKSLKENSQNRTVTRRTLCKAGLVSSVLTPISVFGQPPNRLRPQRGDQLIFEEGPHQGELVRPDLLEINQQPVSAMAREPQTQVLRDGSRLNRVMITRVDTALLEAGFQENAASGVIAYSAVCTHTGCDVINWNAELLRMACPCHESQFDIYAGARVVGGPAPRPLAMLPLALQDGVIIVAGDFSGRVGFTQQF